MKIGVISDLHGSLEDTKKALDILAKETDLIICAGDILYHGPRNPIPETYNPKEVAKLINQFPKKIIFARGNCDAEVDQMLVKYPILQEISAVYVEGIYIVVTHGHKIPQEELPEFAEKMKADILITGHTHIPVVENFKTCAHLNPGSITFPKNNSPRSYAIINVEKGTYNIELKELK